jgi:nitrite reductase/ring-hydroxylating ferredoxin subunit
MKPEVLGPATTDTAADAVADAAAEVAAEPGHALGGASDGDVVRVPGAGQLQHGETRVFELRYQGRSREGFVLQFEGHYYAYLNECPHWSVELDLGDGHFFDEELGRVYCKNHGALFSPTTGECEMGPCRGRSLVTLRLRRDGEDVLVSP